MMRQSSSRNQRTKGIRTKSIIQICLLAAVSFWLIYQLKHSYDKKKVSDDRSSRKLNDVVDSQAEFIKLGRKDLPHSELTNSASDAIKDEENEQAEEDEDPELRREMEAVEREQVGDDDIDEQDHERDEEQENQEMDDDEAESGEDTANERDEDDQAEDEQVLGDQEHAEDFSNGSREEIYKNDDASSAVHRENLEAKEEDGNRETNDANAVRTEGKGIEREDTSVLKNEGSKDISVSSVVDTRADDETISDNADITGTSFQKRETEEILKEPNATALLALKNQEKLHAHLSTGIQTAEAPANLSNLSNGDNSSALVHNQNAKSNSDEDNIVTSNIQAQENNRPKADGAAKEWADGSNRTMEQQDFDNNSTPTLATRENEPNNPEEPAGLSQQITIEEGRLGGIDQSSLPNNLQNVVTSSGHDSA